ncbi:DUF6906 family protein [Alkalihalobacterium alkalinitrilicum]|uniref:DUF6906 family protein n=1 Tax=Alkalihalobacterium alkalinitrilicum TaxID=427920 RepID=UPI000994BC73|nr:hypothetical protein [Alkalihalobacterium alkalinitrilicum]
MIYKIPIPQCYIWMSEGYSNRGILFKRYVEGYIAKSFPDMRLIRISGMTAICERSVPIMKQGKRPTKKQKIAIEERGLKASDWLITKSLTKRLHIIHKSTGEEKELAI